MRYEPEAVHLLADSYWHVVIIVVILLSIVGIIFGGWEFMTVIGAQRAADSGATPSKQVGFTPASLQSTLKSFDDRKAMYDSTVVVKPDAVDPSK